MTRLDNYRDAVRNAGLRHLLSDADRLTFACKIAGFSDKVGVVGFNSAWTSSRPDLPPGRTEQGILLMAAEWQLKSLHESIRECPVKIALIHHPPTWLHEAESVHFGSMLQSRFSLLFHGHEHVLDLTPTINHLTVSGGACHTATDDPKAYNYIRIDLATGTVEVFRRIYDDRGEGRWKADTYDGFDVNGRIEYQQLLHVKAPGSASKPKRARRSSQPRPRKGRMTQPVLASNGLIICCDINEFSGQDLEKQQFLIKRLWSTLQAAPLFEAHRARKRVFAGEAADGLIVGFLDSVVPKEAVALAERLIKSMSTANHKPGIRVGLHYGVFVSVRVSPSRSVITGTGINECSSFAHRFKA
jgi:hypothetical protein